ncbi:MAG TPA: hypothetical protein VGK40_11580 [Verrucomicrobiae bacterium]
MMRTRLIAGTAALVTAWAALLTTRAAEQPEGAPLGQPGREELRERLKNLTPEERQEKLKEFRDKRGGLPEGLLRVELQKFHDEIKNLPPEEREARIKEFREKHPNLPVGPALIAGPERAEIEKFRDEIRNLPPEEREARIKEFRESHPNLPPSALARPNRVEFEKFRETVKDLPPAERAAKMKAWREKNGGVPPALRDMPPDEREAKRNEIKERLQKRLEDFRKKKTDGTITEPESRQLERMEEMVKRFEQGGPGLGTGRPAGPDGANPPARRPSPQE